MCRLGAARAIANRGPLGRVRIPLALVTPSELAHQSLQNVAITLATVEQKLGGLVRHNGD